MALSDIDLVTLANAARDESAFAELVRRHQAGVRAFLRRLTRDASQADDLAQESLLKAYKKLSTFAGGASFRSWLYAIAYREFLQTKRKDAARGRLAEAVANNADGVAPSGGRDISIDLRRALDSLEENERAAILFCDAVGFSHGEAAAALGAPLGSVKTYVARAREKMRAALDKENARASNGDAPRLDGARHG